jgi:tRNA (cytidine/uridine-2'-O-)-methyltransferase
MFHVILFEPEIPPNAGNVIRLCANCGATLHLIEPLGFSLEHKQLVRAGLDYHHLAQIRLHRGWPHCAAELAGNRIFAVSTRGVARYDAPQYRLGDAFLFGPETRGLGREMLEGFPREQRLRIPMRPGNRSLNLSNAVAIIVFEAWRQLEFGGGA